MKKLVSFCVVVILLVFARPLSIALTESDASAELLRFAIYCICFTVPFAIIVQANKKGSKTRIFAWSLMAMM